MSNLRLGDFVIYEMGLDDRKWHARNDAETAWTKRSDNQHLGIVIQFLADGDVRVWDTVEQTWWVADESNLNRLAIA